MLNDIAEPTDEQVKEYCRKRNLKLVEYDFMVHIIKETLSAEPSEDAISRKALLKLMGEVPFNWTDSDKELQEVEDYRNFRNMVEQLPPVKPQEPKTDYKSFCEWVANEIFAEDWEYNKDSFAEIACRKLEKLGIVRAKGDEWELVEPQESEDKE